MTALTRTPAALGHQSVLASAGSGKTFRLSQRYLRLVAAGVPVGSILASTFTRLAAGEIRDRILMRLVKAANDPSALHLLTGDRTGATMDRTKVLDVLRTLTSNMHHVHIRTLDGFFASVVHAFAIELGYAPDSRIVEEHEIGPLRDDAVCELLASRERSGVVELLRSLTQGDSERSIVRVIDSTIDELYDLYRQAPPEAWDSVPPRAELSDAERAQAMNVLREADVPRSLEKARAGDLANVEAGEWERFVSRGVAGALTRGQVRFGKTEIGAALTERYRPLIEHARAVLLNGVRAHTLATRDLLAGFHEHFDRAKRAAGVMTFADLTAAMIDAQQLGSFSDLAFRLDATIAHLLLDEFQDTSVGQWRALEPLAREIVGDETRARSFFCVGDVKQSIYGWRHACPEILETIAGLLGNADVTCERLNHSYRSAPQIIDLVNRTFRDLAHNPALCDASPAAEQFGRGFEPHDTQRTDLAGYAELRTAPAAKDGETPLHVRLRAAAELAARLHRRWPARSIALLTRTNAAVSRLLAEFSPARLDLPAAGRGGGPLTDAPAVTALLSLVTLADHPDDTIAAFHVARGPLGAVVGLRDESDRAARQSVARRVRRQLLEDGYALTLIDLVRRIAGQCDPREHQRVLALVELAGRFDERRTLRPDEFVRFVRVHPVAATSPAPVQVMTIHQAKGLEFDVVILPQLEGKLGGDSTPNVAYERDGVAGPITRICRWIKKPVRELAPELEPLFAAHATRVARESLSLLYVALTRAREAVYALVDPALPNASPTKTLGGVLWGALAPDVTLEPDTVLARIGREDALKPSESEREPAASVTCAAAPAAPLRAALARRRGSTAGISAAAARPASALVDATRSLHQRLLLHDTEAQTRGLVLHRLFEQITWLEESAVPRPEELRVIAREVAPRREAAWHAALVESFLAMLAQPGVRQVLRRDVREGQRVELWRERRFARLVDAGGRERRVQQGSIDRLVATLDASGRATGAEVIDFKTEDVRPDEAETHAARYRAQLETYASVAGGWLDLPPASIALTVLFVTPGLAVRLAHHEAAKIDLPLWR